MKFLGMLILIIVGIAFEQGTGFRWDTFLFGLVGLFMVFPNLLQYLFEEYRSERK